MPHLIFYLLMSSTREAILPNLFELSSTAIESCYNCVFTKMLNILALMGATLEGHNNDLPLFTFQENGLKWMAMGNICPKFPSVLLYPLFSLLNSYSSNNIGLVYSPCVISCFHAMCCLTLVSIIACKASRLGPGSTGGASMCPKIPPFVNCRTDSCKKKDIEIYTRSYTSRNDT